MFFFFIGAIKKHSGIDVEVELMIVLAFLMISASCQYVVIFCFSFGHVRAVVIMIVW